MEFQVPSLRRQETINLVNRLREGDPHAEEMMVPLLYSELKALARRYTRSERIGHTLQTTALVHEAYLKMVGRNEMEWRGRAHFIGVACRCMRQILVDYARRRNSKKRNRGQAVELDEAILLLSETQSRELEALDDALLELTKLSDRQSRIVEMRFFGGLTFAEIAEVLSVSERTIKRDWTVARLWLHQKVMDLS